MLVGNPIVNDKGPMAAFMVAAKAIREAGVPLAGSVYLTMVAGEIGQEPEGTSFRKGWVEAGKAFYKVTVYGGRALYTPYLARPFDGPNPNAILRAIPVLERIEAWVAEYEREHRYESPGGTVVPRVNIGAIRAGLPSMLLQNPELCLIYLDVRTVPGQPTEEIGRELRAMLAAAGVEGEVEQFLNRPAYEARGIEPLSAALDEAHLLEFGGPCELASPAECSMWRDHNVFNEVGIPALTYGPPAVVGAGQYAVAKSDLARAARVYALTAVALCS